MLPLAVRANLRSRIARLKHTEYPNRVYDSNSQQVDKQCQARFVA